MVGRRVSRFGHRPDYSITSSARPSRGSGTVTPSALAVLRLMVSSTFTACWTGRLDQIVRQRRQSINLALRPAVFDRHVLAVDITGFL